MHMVSRQVLRWLGRREWIPFGVRDRVIRHFADPNLQTPNPYEVEFFGMRYRGDLSNFIDWSVYFYGAYEKANLALLRDLARSAGRGCTFVDVGANVGQHSLWMSQYCQDVHAFEPWAAVRRHIEEKIAANRVRNIAIHGVALGGAERGTPVLRADGHQSGIGIVFGDAQSGTKLVVSR